MARSSGANSGCLGLFILLLPFFWIYDKCSGADERRAQERIEAQQREAREDGIRARDRALASQVAAQRKAAEEKAAADLLAAQKAQLASWKPYQRVQAVQKCAKGDCPEGAPNAELVIAAAKTTAERKQLQALNDQLDRVAERANSPLRCCDGSDSPSCTCGRANRRGCCSHHGGICGCSAD
jgi:hypothetical protein